MESISSTEDRLMPKDCLTHDNVLDEAGNKKSVITGLDVPKTADMMMEQFNFVHVVENRVTYIYLNNCGGFSPDVGGKFIPKYLYDWFRPYYTNDGKPIMNKYKVSEIVGSVTYLL